MSSNESPSVSVSRCGHSRRGSRPPHTVVWVRGEHDIATRGLLSATIAQAALLSDADLLVDLSGVTFMDASTIGVLVAARNGLRAPARSLSVGAPSPPARRLLDLCGLAKLIDEHPSSPPVAAALRSWVDVPADRGPDRTPSTVAPAAPSREPVRVMARRRVESTEPAPQQPRAPS